MKLISIIIIEYESVIWKAKFVYHKSIKSGENCWLWKRLMKESLGSLIVKSG